MQGNYIRLCKVMLLCYRAVLYAGFVLMSVCVDMELTQTHTDVLMILHWAYERSYLSLPLPLLQQCSRHFLSPIIYLHWATHHPPIAPCHTEKASLSSRTAITMPRLRGTLTLVRWPIVPAGRFP